jgi:NAD+ synthase
MSVPSVSVTELLRIDPTSETQNISSAIREIVLTRFRRKGAIVAVSGGIDSSVVAALCVEALGPENVIALFLPEADSSSESLRLGKMLTSKLGIRAFEEDISLILESAGCYRRRDDAIRAVVPEYGPGYKSKIVLPNMVANDTYAVFSLVVQSPLGEVRKVRLPLDSYLGIVAASNFKQRTRKMMEYYYADRHHYAVAGTPNRLEYDQGFFVKNGDGSADFKPIAHLYKSQVYQLAAYLNVPEEIQRRPSTTDTYSLEQSQEEFYFSMPLAKMDLCLYGKDHKMPPAELASLVDFTEEQINRVYQMIESKRKVAQYLHGAPMLMSSVAR